MPVHSSAWQKAEYTSGISSANERESAPLRQRAIYNTFGRGLGFNVLRTHQVPTAAPGIDIISTILKPW